MKVKQSHHLKNITQKKIISENDTLNGKYLINMVAIEVADKEVINDY